MSISISDQSATASQRSLEARLKAESTACGFDVVGISTAAAPLQQGERLDAFLADGRHGDMMWMADNLERRRAPNGLWPDAQSVIMLGMNYGPDCDPMTRLAQQDRGVISVYAAGEDYHDLVKKRLKRVARWLVAETGANVKVFVDTAPLMEKPAAARAGLGWQGKHTNLVSRDLGSWLFLGAIFTTATLAPDTPEINHCGSCHACLDICPTNAFPAPYQLDARRCISYLTIEHKGHIAEEFRKPMGNRIYGCDDCLAVCPWNKFAETARQAQFHARAETDLPPLAELAALDDSGFRAWFRKSPIKRTGRDRFVRNVMIAIGNSGKKALLPDIKARLDDGSPLVRAMAVWALGQLAPQDEIDDYASRFESREKDADVLEEWVNLKQEGLS